MPSGVNASFVHLWTSAAASFSVLLAGCGSGDQPQPSTASTPAPITDAAPAPGPSGDGTPSDDRATLVDLHRAYRRAFEAGDSGSMQAIVTPSIRVHVA